MAGKAGLALSGGGFRASLFHIGVLARLAELDVLRHVEVLSCVSGGSIVGAHYYLEVRALLQSKTDREITAQDYIDIIKRIEKNFLKGVQKDLRNRLFAGWIANLRSVFQPGYTRTTYLGELFERHLYADSFVRNLGSSADAKLATSEESGTLGRNPPEDGWRIARSYCGAVCKAVAPRRQSVTKSTWAPTGTAPHSSAHRPAWDLCKPKVRTLSTLCAHFSRGSLPQRHLASGTISPRPHETVRLMLPRILCRAMRE